MLPSCGHFKNIPCPFYKLALCVRPHCPYKHQTTDNGHPRQIFSQLVDETESLLDSKLNLNVTPDITYVTPNAAEENVTYIPTPVDSKPPGILKSSNSILEKSTSIVPEYKPTPISKLKECNNTFAKKSNKSEYAPEFPTAIRKKKNVEEYDPTEVKCIPKKSVSFIDPTSPADSDVPVILISSEDELDDSESAPKFSDDDLEEESTVIPTSKKKPFEVNKLPAVNEPVKEEEIEIIEINEFSVVDKILVDSKKNDLLLKAKQNPKLLPKVNELTSKVNVSQKQDTNTTILPEKVDIKHKQLDSNITIKTEKPFLNPPVSKVDSGHSKPVLKTKKNSNSAVPRVKNTNSIKKEIKTVPIKESKSDSIKKDNKTIGIKKEKTDKLQKSKDKIQKHDKPLLTHKKDKLSKDSQEQIDIPKFSKKGSKEKKITTHEDSKKTTHEKILKTDNHPIIHSLDKSTLKKRSNEEQNFKPSSSNNSPSLKKMKNFESALTSSEPGLNKPKEKKSSKHSSSIKRKFEDSDSKHRKVKHKSLSPDKKRAKSDNSTSKSPKHKSVDHRPTLKLVSDYDPKSDDDFMDSCDITSDLSDSDPDEECRRIFNECYPESSNNSKLDKKEVSSQQNTSNSADIVILRKKRLAHPGALDVKKPVSAQKKVDVKKLINPAQVMYNRFAQVQSKIAKQNGNQDTTSDSSGKGTEKKRLNFVPNHSLLAAVKNKVIQDNPALSKYSPFLPAGVSKTLKVTQRVAHIPEAALKPRPIIPADFGSKVPSNVRQKFLNAFIDECLKFSPSEDEAYDNALEEEKKAYDRSSSKALYMNVAANTLKRLRNQAKEGPQNAGSASLQNISKRTVSHQTVLNGPLAQRRSFSIGPKKQTFDIKDLGRSGLYEHLLQYVLTLEQLKENGFPQPHPVEKDRAVIEGVYANRANYCNDAFKRICCRCQKTYYVNVDGEYVRDEECDFHWGRLWKKRIAGALESRYSCCQGDAETDGCCVSAGHVFEGSEAHALKGFMKTLPKTPPRDNFYGIYALDCEMCYTTAGMELTRVTVIDNDLKPVYESFVKPQHKVLDFNTRFSGITEDDLKTVRTTIHDVQAVLLCIFNDRTMLIGHSLESDFKALKIFHKTVIDTSVVFPHKNGLPFKRALRTLMAEKLNKIIQNDVGGHDSHEDAAACMELMLWKIKEDLKGNR